MKQTFGQNNESTASNKRFNFVELASSVGVSRGVSSQKVLRELESLSPVRALAFPRPNTKPPTVGCYLKKQRQGGQSMEYNEEKVFLEKVEDKNSSQNERHLLCESELDLLRLKYDKISSDFWDYLKYIGSGSFRENQFAVYGHLIKLEDIEVFDELNIAENIVFFGDNFSGDLSGFELDGDGTVVEYWHDSGEIYKTGQSFLTYIRQQMLMDENGNDLRI